MSAFFDQIFRQLQFSFLPPARCIAQLPVTAAATTVTYTFPGSEVDTAYGVLALTNWSTNTYVSARTKTSLTLTFSVAAPASATVSILVFRS